MNIRLELVDLKSEKGHPEGVQGPPKGSWQGEIQEGAKEQKETWQAVAVEQKNIWIRYQWIRIGEREVLEGSGIEWGRGTMEQEEVWEFMAASDSLAWSGSGSAIVRHGRYGTGFGGSGSG
jgi:hypothetical protein